MKKFKKAKIITALCSAITIIGTTLFLVSCSDTAGSDTAELPSNPQERQTLLNNVVQNIINEVIQEDNGGYQNVEEKNKVNKEAEEIAKEIFNKDFWGFKYYKFFHLIQIKEEDEWNNRYGPVILETVENILQIPGIQEAGNKPFAFNDVAKERIKTAITAAKLKAREEFTQQVKQEAKKIVQNEDNKAEAQQKAQESGVEEAKKFLENKIKQGINENINRYSDSRSSNWSQHHWNKKILELATEDTGWSLFIVKNSSFKHYIEEIERIFQKKELREAIVTLYKYLTLGALDKSESITNEKVRTKAKKIVTKVFENKAFQTAFVEDGLLHILYINFDMFSSSDRVREGIEKLNLI